MPMDPVTTNSTPVNGPSPLPVAPSPPPTSVIPTAVGASGPPVGVTPPVTPPVVTVPVPPQAVDSPELTAIRADRARLEAEVARLTPYAALGYRASQQQQTQPAAPVVAPAATKVNAFGVPELDPNIAAWVQTDAAGNVTELPGAPPGSAAQYIAHQRALGNALKKLATDPEGALGPLVAKLKAEAAEEAKKQVTADQVAYRNQQVAGQIMQANEPWMFEKDGAGNKVIVHDPLKGTSEYKRTQVGDWWVQAATNLMNQGVTDPMVIDDMARSYAHRMAWTAAQQQQAAATVPGQVVVPIGAAPQTPPVVPPIDLKTAFLNSVPGALPGSVQPPGTSAMPGTQKLSLQQAMLQELVKSGYQTGSRLPMAHQQAG